MRQHTNGAGVWFDEILVMRFVVLKKANNKDSQRREESGH